MSSKQNAAGAPVSKKIRMTMACERCRSKKVKCDFAHPQCARCQQAKAECSYDGSATQVDLFNLVKLNETVDILQKRVQSIESDIKDVCSNTQYVANEVRMTRAAGGNQFSEKSTGADTNEQQQQRDYTASPTNSISRSPRMNSMNSLLATSNAQWSLSLTPKGLRIDTNIISLHDLYDILLSGVSQFDLSNGACMHELSNNTANSSPQSSSSTSHNSPESPRPETATVLRKKPLWRTRLKTFPLYSSWEPQGKKNSSSRNLDGSLKSGHKRSNSAILSLSSSASASASSLPEPIPKETLHRMISIYCECFLCLPCPELQQSILKRFEHGTLDPLLANAVFAWTARHAAIYHSLFPGKDPNQVGQSFFLKAKSLVKDRFMKTSIDTMHSLLIMYIYAIGIPSEHKAEVESEAYIYLGLAIRMCLDLKMNAESSSPNPYDKERNRRFFWVLYFLETLGSIHSDKPFALPPRNMVTVRFPTLMEHEKSDEARYRVEFMIQRFKITRIYRNIIYKTTKEKPLLSQISAIDKELENWKAALPSYLKYETGDIHRKRWDSTSFREQACIKLNFEYNFQLCQLYGLFFSKSGTDEDNGANEQQQSAIEVLSREICLKAANNTVELLECWTQLKQLWCHFSLENLMMTTMTYGNILSQANSGERENATKNLEKIAKILLNSPVRHHKYVLTLVGKISLIFKEILNADLRIDGKVLPSEIPSKGIGSPKQQGEDVTTVTAAHLPATESTCPTKQHQQQQQQQQQLATTLLPPTSSIPPNIRHGQHTRTNSTPIDLAVLDQDIQPVSLTNQFTLTNSIYNIFDVASASSVKFDMHKAESFSEDMHFSDFVYTPTLLDYSAAVNSAGMLSSVAANSTGAVDYSQQQRQQGKKRDYTATVADDNCHSQQQYSPSQQQQLHYGYNANNRSSSTCTANNNNSPTQHSISPPTWLEMEHSSSSSNTSATLPPSNNPTDQHQQYMHMNPNFNDNRQRYSTSQANTTPSQQQQQQQPSASSSMKNYYNNCNNSYY
ncbi:hypothetical protein BD408DRAFT_480454 [Parasitella parasitica]|nr:hypothetical protein BD408DRAFT_480454 [Parasitella parasitica]